jgi:PIN domain nuclease of toxin-antitoxin system
LIVIDAHALIWYLENSPRLSSSARFAFDAIDQGFSVGIVPIIVLAELMHISEKGRTQIDYWELVARLQDSQTFEVLPLDLSILARMRNLNMFELHDHIIVATALSLEARLVTKDDAIRDSSIVECIW